MKGEFLLIRSEATNGWWSTCQRKGGFPKSKVEVTFYSALAPELQSRSHYPVESQNRIEYFLLELQWQTKTNRARSHFWSVSAGFGDSVCSRRNMCSLLGGLAKREISVEGVRTREKHLDYRRRSKLGGVWAMPSHKIFKCWNWVSYLNGV